jgi:hypothetical protein
MVSFSRLLIEMKVVSNISEVWVSASTRSVGRIEIDRRGWLSTYYKRSVYILLAWQMLDLFARRNIIERIKMKGDESKRSVGGSWMLAVIACGTQYDPFLLGGG